MKKMLLAITLMLITVGLAGCDLIGGGGSLPQVCDNGYHLEGTECVVDAVNSKPVISLNGNATMTIVIDEDFSDPGATASDPEDGNITSDIVVDNTVDTAVAGSYTVTYNVQDSAGLAADQVVRTVNVVAVEDNPPVITLIGDASITINVGDDYTDFGATATDNEDGNLTTSIIVSNPVDTSTAGTYTITYNVTDADGNDAVTVTREVVVSATQAEILANYIVDNWDGSLQFLGSVVNDMNFDNSMTLTTELNFAVTEDIDETHYIHAIVEDTYYSGPSLDAIHRVINLDVDNDTQVQLEFLFEQVETGVHVYIKYGPIFDLLSAENPAMITTLSTVGFDDDWALFKLDDSLENVIQMSVVKDMLTTLFFNKMGDMYFYNLQNQIENEIGFDLDQYGVDLGQFIDYVIQGDNTNAKDLMMAIDGQGIVLNLDVLYLAPQLYQFLQSYASDLLADGFDTSKLELLNTAHDDGSGTMVLDVTLDATAYDPMTGQPLFGTQAFMMNLTDAEWTSLADVVIKPLVEQMVYQNLVDQFSYSWLSMDLESIMYMYQQPLENDYGFTDFAAEIDALHALGAPDYWLQLTDLQKEGLMHYAHQDEWMLDVIDHLNYFMMHPDEVEDQMWFTGDLTAILNAYADDLMYTIPDFDLETEIAKVQSLGGIGYWQQLDDWQRDEFRYTVDHSWQGDVINKLQSIEDSYNFMLQFMQVHESMLNEIGFDATAKIVALQSNGIVDFIHNTLTADDVAVLMDAIVYPFIDDLHTAVNDGEVAEFLMQTIFTDPHVTEFLTNNTEPVPFDQSIIAANMMGIDFDALVNETADFNALLQAIYDGQTAYDTYVAGLETTAPNMAKLLAVWSPAVADLAPYMTYVDDLNYAFDGLSAFDSYLDPTYWLADNMTAVDVTVTPDNYVRTDMDMDPVMYQIVAQDVLADINTYLSGFTNIPFPYDSDWNCIDPMNQYCTDADFSGLMAMLTQLGTINVNMTFNPMDPTWMNTTIDLTDFLDVLVYQGNKDILEDPNYVADESNDILTGVTDATISITMSENASISTPDPSNTSDVNAIADTFGKFAISMVASDILHEFMNYYMDNPMELLELTQSSYSLSDFDFLHVSQAFDLEQSTIDIVLPTMPGTMPQLSLQLVWLDGTNAFTLPVTYATLQTLLETDDEALTDAMYTTMVGFVDDANYNTTKLFMIFVLQDNSYDNGMGER